METMLATHYNIQASEKVVLAGRDGYKQDEYVYFTIPSDNREVIHLEQAALAYYLLENRYFHTAIPVANINGDWFTAYENTTYMVVMVEQLNNTTRESSGRSLAAFHTIGTLYSFEPHQISSYGQWKKLWIDKLESYEKNVSLAANEKPDDYFRMVMDTLPYIIGLSENAIQYLQESERENRFDTVDQGTISFQRYTNNLQKSVIWLDDFVFDHPVRDLAEYTRSLLLSNAPPDEIVQFLHDYQSERPLSIFSWRLLYARLLYPVHFFDHFDSVMGSRTFEDSYTAFASLIEMQEEYEKKMRGLYQLIGLDATSLQIPVLHWL
ncbi:protein kinase family protein [Oceanobacillus manasiensis]|uniref:hypothetical protein n=1 Tax=Oceanobacillus manasiensis TaxID=586413 RepID=UPI0006945FCE|nr:hypothetical protein [Oceanobacillus manasiensis]